MFFVKATQGPGGGVFPSAVEVPCINRSGATFDKGDSVQLDFRASVAEVATNTANNYLPGSNTSVFNTIRSPQAASTVATNELVGLQGGIFGIVTQEGGIANDVSGNVAFFGQIDEALVVQPLAAVTIDPGQFLSPSASNNLHAGLGSNARSVPVAIYMAPQDTAQTEKLKRVLLNGFGGFPTGGWSIAV